MNIDFSKKIRICRCQSDHSTSTTVSTHPRLKQVEAMLRVSKWTSALATHMVKRQKELSSEENNMRMIWNCSKSDIEETLGRGNYSISWDVEDPALHKGGQSLKVYCKVHKRRKILRHQTLCSPWQRLWERGPRRRPLSVSRKRTSVTTEQRRVSDSCPTFMLDHFLCDRGVKNNNTKQWLTCT